MEANVREKYSITTVGSQLATPNKQIHLTKIINQYISPRAATITFAPIAVALEVGIGQIARLKG